MAVTYTTLSPLIEVARKSLPDLERDMQEAYHTWQHKKELWEAAKSIVESDDRRRGPRPEIPTAPSAPAQQNLGLSDRAPRGAVHKHVEEVLNEGKPYTHAALKAELMRRFKIDYGNTTIYRALGRGKDEKRCSLVT